MCVGGRSVSCVHVYRKWYSVCMCCSVMVQVCACV